MRARLRWALADDAPQSVGRILADAFWSAASPTASAEVVDLFMPPTAARR